MESSKQQYTIGNLYLEMLIYCSAFIFMKVIGFECCQEETIFLDFSTRNFKRMFTSQDMKHTFNENIYCIICSCCVLVVCSLFLLFQRFQCLCSSDFFGLCNF